MGIFDFIKNAGEKLFGKDDKDDPKFDVVKPLSAHLRENGIDPTSIQFQFRGDTVTLRGHVPDWQTKEKAVLIVGNVNGVGRVDDQLVVGRAPDFSNVSATAGSTAPSAIGGGSQAHAHQNQDETGWRSKTYTVEKGDTLSKIAKEVYGDSSKYPQIFEANKPMLKDADKIYPGQVLRIPPL